MCLNQPLTSSENSSRSWRGCGARTAAPGIASRPMRASSRTCWRRRRGPGVYRRERSDQAARGARRPRFAGRVPRPDGGRGRPLHHRRRPGRDQREAPPPPPPHLRRREGRHGAGGPLQLGAIRKLECEKARRPCFLLDGVPRELPALLRAHRCKRNCGSAWTGTRPGRSSRKSRRNWRSSEPPWRASSRSNGGGAGRPPFSLVKLTGSSP